MNIRNAMELYLVTDRSSLEDETLYEAVEKALQGGVTCVQLREKDLSTDEMIEEAKELLDLCHQYDVPLIINDRIDVMLAADADGLHVGQGDLPASQARKIIGPDKILGVTAKTVKQAKKAQSDGADYLGVGAIFGSITKKEALKISKDQLIEIRESIDIPIVAIGGVAKENIDTLKDTGIDGIAVVSAIMAQSDKTSAAKELKTKVREIIND